MQKYEYYAEIYNNKRLISIITYLLESFQEIYA